MACAKPEFRRREFSSIQREFEPIGCAGPGEGASHFALDGNSVLVMRIPSGVDLWRQDRSTSAATSSRIRLAPMTLPFGWSVRGSHNARTWLLTGRSRCARTSRETTLSESNSGEEEVNAEPTGCAAFVKNVQLGQLQGDVARPRRAREALALPLTAPEHMTREGPSSTLSCP
jgi:hypothetical protein